MATQKNPDIPILFRGLDMSGNPARRPSMSASKAQDIRIMPGEWIRLRGGRKMRYNTVGGTVMQIHSFRDPNLPGSTNHMAQIKYAGASTVNWTWFDVSTYVIDPFGIKDISTSYDSSFALSNPAAIANITDRPVFYTGLGRRDGTDSRPPFASYYGGVVRYFGLDAYCPAGTKPTVAFAAGAGNNSVNVSVRFYAGLYHEPTGHYSNGVYCGKITTTGATGTITVSNLDRLAATYNNNTERGELYYVFYASIDGFEVPYLIMDSTHTGPLKLAITSTSKSLSVEAADIGTENGWFLDRTTEMPVQNFPPRPMKALWAVNQRLYGIPLNGGSGTGSDFTYQWPTRSLASVVWSKAPGDDRDTKVVGDPQQSWPLENIKFTPNIETPIWGCASLGGDASIVWTPSSTFIMQELSNGVHLFNSISEIHGLVNPMTVKKTDYGIAWVDQNNQICLLSSDTKEGLSVISIRYQEALVGKTTSCADYLIDPNNDIDRYQVWFTDATSLCHDFRLRSSEFPEGMAYTCTGQDFTAAATVRTTDGKRHHIVAKGGFYTQEAQAETGKIPTTDDTFSNTTNQTYTTADVPTAVYHFNWNRITDWNERKKLAGINIIGDGKTSAHLSDVPAKVKWWGDFADITGSPQTLNAANIPQTSTDWQYYFAPTQANRFFFKIGFTLQGHSADDTDFLYHRRPGEEGDLDKNFYGSILEASLLIGNEGNRP